MNVDILIILLRKLKPKKVEWIALWHIDGSKKSWMKNSYNFAFKEPMISIWSFNFTFYLYYQRCYRHVFKMWKCNGNSGNSIYFWIVYTESRIAFCPSILHSNLDKFACTSANNLMNSLIFDKIVLNVQTT